MRSRRTGGGGFRGTAKLSLLPTLYKSIRGLAASSERATVKGLSPLAILVEWSESGKRHRPLTTSVQLSKAIAFRVFATTSLDSSITSSLLPDLAADLSVLSPQYTCPASFASLVIK